MILLSVIAAIAGLFGFHGTEGDLQSGSLNSRAITIVESSHRIEFPDRIVFTLEADAPPDVQSARLYYTVGPHNVKVYTYPVRFTNSENIQAQFIINTGKDGFIPQGVEIEYYYVFTDSLGNRTVMCACVCTLPAANAMIASCTVANTIPSPGASGTSIVR